MNNDDHIQIGKRHGWGDSQPFGIGTDDQRHHVYIIGKTGSGKSTLLRNLILQHILLGHGVGVIDPHGDLAQELLNHIPTAPCWRPLLFQSWRPGVPHRLQPACQCSTR